MAPLVMQTVPPPQALAPGALQATQRLVVVLQLGVAPEQSALVTHWAQRPGAG